MEQIWVLVAYVGYIKKTNIRSSQLPGMQADDLASPEALQTYFSNQQLV